MSAHILQTAAAANKAPRADAMESHVASVMGARPPRILTADEQADLLAQLGDIATTVRTDSRFAAALQLMLAAITKDAGAQPSAAQGREAA